MDRGRAAGQDAHMAWLKGKSEQQPTPPAPDAVRMTAWVHGHVQGVGFRWWTRSRALELGLVGSASNLADGRVEVVAEGPPEICEALLAQLRGAKTPGGVTQVVAQFADARGGFAGFDTR
jgi:acylphosphatase